MANSIRVKMKRRKDWEFVWRKDVWYKSTTGYNHKLPYGFYHLTKKHIYRLMHYGDSSVGQWIGMYDGTKWISVHQGYYLGAISASGEYGTYVWKQPGTALVLVNTMVRK